MQRVLVADDEPIVRRVIARVLEKLGVQQVVEASNGEEALARLSEAPFDLIVLDRNMPVMDGLEFLRVVRERRVDVPVMMVTAEAQRESVVEAVQAGATDYLVKPLDQQVLRKKLQDYCCPDEDREDAAVCRARQVMNPNVVTIGADASVEKTIEAMLEHDVSALPVIDDQQRLCGIITEYQLIKAIRQPEITGKQVRALMTKDVMVVREDTTLPVIAKMMEKYHIRQTPVLRDGRIVGIVARRDVLRHVSSDRGALDELLTEGSA